MAILFETVDSMKKLQKEMKLN